MAASTPTILVGNNWAGGPARLTSYTQDVSTGGGNPLTTTPLTLFTLPASGYQNRALTVSWTGDQTLDLSIQYDLGSGGNGFQTIAKIHFLAGNGTAQTAMFYPSVSAGAAAGTSLISGTQPAFAAAPAVSSWEFLKAVADRIRLVAVAGSTTTVGTLTIDLNEGAA